MESQIEEKNGFNAKDIQHKHLIDNLNEKQIQTLNKFKVAIEEKSNAIFADRVHLKQIYTEENQLIRVLIAREFKEKEAFMMWEKWVQWRLENKADEMDENDIINELRAGKAFFFGYDQKKNPILVVKIKKHFPGQIPFEETKKYFLYLMEVGIKLSEQSGTEKISILYDREGFDSSKNFDSSMYQLIKQIVVILQDNYAERLDTCFILHPNWFFKMMFSIVKPFLTKRTKEKFKIINDVNELQKFIDPSQMMVEHSGTSNYEYQFPPPYHKLYKNKQENNLQQDQQLLIQTEGISQEPMNEIQIQKNPQKFIEQFNQVDTDLNSNYEYYQIDMDELGNQQDEETTHNFSYLKRQFIQNQNNLQTLK